MSKLLITEIKKIVLEFEALEKQYDSEADAHKSSVDSASARGKSRAYRYAKNRLRRELEWHNEKI